MRSVARAPRDQRDAGTSAMASVPDAFSIRVTDEAEVALAGSSELSPRMVEEQS